MLRSAKPTKWRSPARSGLRRSNWRPVRTGMFHISAGCRNRFLEAEFLPTVWTNPKELRRVNYLLMGGLHWNPIVRVTVGVDAPRRRPIIRCHMPGKIPFWGGLSADPAENRDPAGVAYRRAFSSRTQKSIDDGRRHLLALVISIKSRPRRQDATAGRSSVMDIRNVVCSSMIHRRFQSVKSNGRSRPPVPGTATS